MVEVINWQRTANQLTLSGNLDRCSLTNLWQQRKTVMENVDVIDVSAVERVDSAGLALLVHLREVSRDYGRTLRFKGINERLSALINLYNLQEIIISDDQAA